MTNKLSLTTKIIKYAVTLRRSSVKKDIKAFKFNNCVCENVRLKTKDNVSIGAYLVTPNREIQKCFVFLHGNACNRENTRAQFNFEFLGDKGICFMVLDYRGFGDSDGDFCVEGVGYDVDACVDYMFSKFGKKVNIVGFSLGGGVALEHARFNYFNKSNEIESFDVYHGQKLKSENFDDVSNSVYTNTEKTNQNNVINDINEANNISVVSDLINEESNTNMCSGMKIDLQSEDTLTTQKNIFKDKRVGKYVIISSFSSLAHRVKENTIFKIIEKIFPNCYSNLEKEFNFNSIENIKYIDKKDVLLFHGTHDTIISHRHSMLLQKVSGCVMYLESKKHLSCHMGILHSRDMWKKMLVFFD
ncbi:hypothetical protein EDEG_01539 [Edhazardia aedis USNM 41457]|uniref:AB hydrolase-1 domain-containing protein n=1 Tax=Edhazardia aedis (strain USNM 41457) TaxID=1003232 RepID=J9D9J2_EDHAE|nr:hypothetical protein EDEG_01539 [Edhazardia aedis USNM 41457]|eukprot:EJW04164.1 hypothetical protein EDEG_01539 [Edhazardia aedis USNM 41457]